MPKPEHAKITVDSKVELAVRPVRSSQASSTVGHIDRSAMLRELRSLCNTTASLENFQQGDTPLTAQDSPFARPAVPARHSPLTPLAL